MICIRIITTPPVQIRQDKRICLKYLTGFASPAFRNEKNINKKQKNAPIGTPIYKLSSVKAVSSKLNVKFFKINHYIHVQNRHMIQFTIRQSYKHVDSLSLIIAYFNLQFHFFPPSIIFSMGIHHLFDGSPSSFRWESIIFSMDLHILTEIKSVFNGVTLCVELQDFAA